MSISALPKALFRKWENILFWVLAAALTAFIVSWSRGLEDEGGSTLRPRNKARPGSLLDTDTAFAFRDQLEDIKLKDPHPFFARPELDRGGTAGPTTPGSGEKRKRRPWKSFRQRKTPEKTTKPTPKVVRPTVVRSDKPTPRKPTPPKPTPAKPAPAKPAPAPAPAPPAPAPKPDKPKKKIMRVVEHRGVVGTPSGKQFALVQEVNTKQIAFVEAGSTLGDFRVESFGNDSLQVTGPDGKTHSIAFGSQKKIVIE